VDDNKIGNVISGVRIYALYELEEVIKTFRIDMIILTVPSVIATGVLEKLKDTGVKGILNFAPIRLRDIGDIVVNNIDLSIELERLSFGLKK
ncbi:MAG: redox-sensing transcriptional repressor Rex, partial [Elusimicrobiota bacterium]